MAIGEQARHELYRRLQQALGEEATATLMAYLPPTGWADLATRTDLARLETKIEALGNVLRAEFHRELNAVTRTVIFSVIGANVGLAGLALALSRLNG